MNLSRRYEKPLGMVLVFIFWGTLILFLVAKIEYLIDSDMSSELCLAKLLSHEKAILSTNWYYSTELRLLNTQLVYTPLFYIFYSWKAVRISGIAILCMILIASVFYLCKKANCSRYFPLIAVSILVPISKEYFYITLFGTYYIPHIVISFITIGLACNYCTQNKKCSIVISAVLAVLACAGGPRQMMCLYLPMFISEVILLISSTVKNGLYRSREELYHFVFATVCMCAGGIGYIINKNVLSNIYSVYIWPELSFTKFSIDNCIQVLTGLLVTFGYTQGRVTLSSIISGGISGLLLVALVMSVVKGIRDKGKVSNIYHAMSVYFVCAIAVFMMLYSFTDMSYVSRYNEPVAVFVYVLIALWIKEADWKEGCKKVVCAVCILLLATTAINGYSMIASDDKTGEMRKISNILVDNGYSNVVATFWNANVLTELSDGEINAYSYADMSQLQSFRTILRWLQSKSHAILVPTGKVCVLFSNAEISKYPYSDSLPSEKIIFQTDAHTLYGFSSYEEFRKIAPFYVYDFTALAYVIGGEDVDGVRYLHPGAISYGPYIELSAGRYQVTITGNNLKNGTYDCMSYIGSNSYELEDFLVSNHEVSYQLTLPEDTKQVEVRVFNNSNTNISLNKIQINEIYD